MDANRTEDEGSRGPRKGNGGRPKTTTSRRGRSLFLCRDREWPLLWRYSNGTSYTDRVRDCLNMTANTRGARAKIATRWKEILGGTVDRRDMVSPQDVSIYLGEEEWDKLAKLFPVGSWADKIRQLIELCKIVKAASRRTKKQT